MRNRRQRRRTETTVRDSVGESDKVSKSQTRATEQEVDAPVAFFGHREPEHARRGELWILTTEIDFTRGEGKRRPLGQSNTSLLSCPSDGARHRTRRCHTLSPQLCPSDGPIASMLWKTSVSLRTPAKAVTSYIAARRALRRVIPGICVLVDRLDVHYHRRCRVRFLFFFGVIGLNSNPPPANSKVAANKSLCDTWPSFADKPQTCF